MRLTFALVLLAACGPSTSQTTSTAATTVGTPPADSDSFQITFERPPIVGQRYRLTTTTETSQAQTFRQDGGAEQSEVARNRVTINGVLERTGELTFKVEVEAFSVIADEAEADVPVAPGAVIEVTRGDPSQISVNGEVVTGQLADWIGLVLPDGPPRNDDDMYGTSDPQPIGGTWNFRPEVVSELLQRMRVQVPAAEIHGGFQVVERVPESDSVRVRGSLEMDTLDFPAMPNATVESGAVRIAMEWLLPADQQLVSPHRTMEMSMTANIRISDPESGDSGMLNMTFQNSRVATLQPL